jgi:dTDP-glucose 4,6-dehydratase
MSNIFITGGLGFIGSNFVNKYITQCPDDNVIIIDNQTYAASKNNITNLSKINIEYIDISNFEKLYNLYIKYTPEITIHFAAQTHVDNSIHNDSPFITTNICGTHNILQCILKTNSRLMHISTDEVFGSLEPNEKPFTEYSPYKPNNPYSASKASSDLLVRSYIKTHKIKAVITNCSNNYGPRQHAEKLIPKIIQRAMNDLTVPLYGNGLNIRDWLYVDDHCDALLLIKDNFISGERYNIGGNYEITNLDIIRLILKILNKSETLIQFVEDRPGHDLRYSINSSKIYNELKWKPKTDIYTGLQKTIEWYSA